MMHLAGQRGSLNCEPPRRECKSVIKECPQQGEANVLLSEPRDYKKIVRDHLQKCRPREFARAKQDGSLNNQVSSLANTIFDIVNSQMPKPEELANLSPLERANRLSQARIFAESEAMREVLPRDEETESLIGPSGGYEDPPNDSDA